jgi:hypothetical protein
MAHPQKPERRTYSQDRFDILIKKKRNGQASFKDLTELDEIINSDLTIRAKVLEEMKLESEDFSDNQPESQEKFHAAKKINLIELFKSWTKRLFFIKAGYILTNT